MTTRLEVFSIESLDAEERSEAAISALLGVAPPAHWPPPFNDAAVRRWFRGQLQADPLLAPWLGYYIVSAVAGRDTLVGMAGFKGPPDAAGTVEIGYSLVDAYHRRGIGSAAVGLLVQKAFADPRVRLVRAETPEDFSGSRGLLEKCGFALAGRRSDPEDGALVVYEFRRN